MVDEKLLKLSDVEIANKSTKEKPRYVIVDEKYELLVSQAVLARLKFTEKTGLLF